MADWLEKMSVGAMLIGAFQDRPEAGIIGIALLLSSLYLTRRSL
jgi:hypothetical protein